MLQVQLQNGYQVDTNAYVLFVIILLNIGAQATPESYKQWKIRADATMITSDNSLEENSSSNDSLYFNE